MGTTPWLKIPYPEPNAFVKDGAAAMQSLALGTEKAVPAFNLTASGGQIGRAPTYGDRGIQVSFWGSRSTNGFGQVSFALPAGVAGWASVAAMGAGGQNGSQLYFVVDNTNSSVANVVLYVYAQSNNALMINYGASFTATVFGWAPIV